MKLIIATSITLFFATIVPSTAAPAPADTAGSAPTSTAGSAPTSTAGSAPTSTLVPMSMPQDSVTCLGYTVSVNNIEAAVVQGYTWASSSPPIQMGTRDYPHVFNNYEKLSFPNCKGSQYWEYPVLRNGANPWVPSKDTVLKNQPDRVIFTFGTDRSKPPTYCGTITHDPNKETNKGKKGAFSICI